MTPDQALDEGTKWAVRALIALLTWLGLHHLKLVRRQGARIAKLESQQVTREQLDELRESVNETVRNAFAELDERLESRTRDTNKRIDRLFERLSGSDR